MLSLTAFLDTSVVLSGLTSPTGGSAKLIQAARQGKITLLITPLVLTEALRHLHKLHLKKSELEALLNTKVLTLIPDPPTSLISKCQKIASDPNDAHILAAAIKSHTGYLISLDQKHIITPKIQQTLKPINVLTPKLFWYSLL